ncbi:polysaccharide deacetylase family protein [Streptococcus sp. zg-86]|uniref:Polysaccharide deacetylase family protein n=1 Tax=Streptococcus zhangguiae TaxID=2664091 RepID=A0A6I4R9L8_9STRE|nr:MULTISPECIES: polysaccharide deacetylase family protein [unclassified Streptococcus]MTB64192.1 polysaccharide deacetylase family protein [Streptococcus sp. zg-86]MTB90482.1 polysaccharide deacetylase family protein [Streptococcus sp. zg-36]MWV56179.1 polysaccharide deacetylase family protein [Streptococcus sp. zg-70]QTH48199.1 polysaccharide deacetylase family protein [Streptococcus sp. zg-86]
MKKGMILIVVNLVLLGLVAMLGMKAFTYFQDQKIARFISEKQTTILNKQDYVIQSGNIDTTHVEAGIPKDSNGQVNAVFKEKIEAYVAEKVGTKKPSGKIKELFFVSVKDVNTNFSGVEAKQIQSERYHVHTFSISSAESETGGTVLVTKDNQPFTLETFVADSQSLKAAFSAQLKSDLAAKQLAEADIEKMVAQFEASNLANYPFVYQQSQLIIDLPEKEFQVKQLALPIATIFGIVKEEFLASEDQQAYATYQAEEEAKKHQKRIALTFDDGPSAITTPQVLDILKKYKAKATFFVLGQNIAGNEELLKRIVAEGHEVASHTWDHADLRTLSGDQVKQEMDQTREAIQKVIGQEPKMMRPPYGSVNQAVMSVMQLPVIYWSVDSKDWQSRNATSILGEVKACTYPGSIILMHDIHQPTVDSLTSVLEFLLGEGYEPVTVSELLGKNLNPQLIYYDQQSSRPGE